MVSITELQSTTGNKYLGLGHANVSGCFNFPLITTTNTNKKTIKKYYHTMDTVGSITTSYINHVKPVFGSTNLVQI